MTERPGGVREAGPTARDRALAQYRGRASRYDTELIPFEPIRADAIERLCLRRGDTVLDVGCGTGLSFEALLRGVGPDGRVVGVEPSPEMLAQAKWRIHRHGWSNVALVQEGAASAPLHGQADAALFHFTHDVLRDDAAIRNILAHLKPGARVVASGLQWAPEWWWPTNGFVLLAALYSTTSLEGLAKPWDKLAAHLDDLQVETAYLGGFYIASGLRK